MTRFILITSGVVLLVCIMCLAGMLIIGQSITSWELVYAQSLSNASGWQIYLYDIHRDLSTPFYFAPASVESINSHFRRELDISFIGPAVSLSPDRRFLVREGFSPTGVVLYVHDLQTGQEFVRSDLSTPIFWSPVSRNAVVGISTSQSGLVSIDEEGNWGEVISFPEDTSLDVVTYLTVWSPDNTMIAFPAGIQNPDSTPNLSSSIYVMNSNGSNLRNLTPEMNVYALLPFWSPDGTMIGFVASENDGGQGIYVVNLDGTNLRRLTSSDIVSKPAWSPDGTMIAFPISGVPTTRLAIYSITNDEVIVMTHVDNVTSTRYSPTGITGPVWSPDSRYLLYLEYAPINPLTDESYLQIVDLHTGNVRRLINEEVIWIP